MRMPQKMVDEAQAAVDKGAAVLDRRRPAWFTRINCKTLDLSSGCDCILGQLYGEYGATALQRALGRAFSSLFNTPFIRSAERHAFCSTQAMDRWMEEGPEATYDLRHDACYHLLDRMWLKKIEERLAPADQKRAA